jgi:hypothetical protein
MDKDPRSNECTPGRGPASAGPAAVGAKTGTGPNEIAGLKQSFAACGKLAAMFNQLVLSAKSVT